VANFVINRGFANQQTVNAERFHTVGDFVDFVEYAEGEDRTVFRISAKLVHTVARDDAASTN
jgi:hypothetical protein